MTHESPLRDIIVAVSVSESPDMPTLGLSEQHLHDATAELARYLLALGARLAYGGDLRRGGFTEVLLELVARHARDAGDADQPTSVRDYLAWPVHVAKPAAELESRAEELTGYAELVLLDLDGKRTSPESWKGMTARAPTEAEWAQGLSAMRRTMLEEIHARIVLGGRIEGYKGQMPGVADESLMSLQAGSPLFVVGGFGGCARDLAETLGLLEEKKPRSWPSREDFRAYSVTDLNNGLTNDENELLARTPHIDQAIVLILRGLLRLGRTTKARDP